MAQSAASSKARDLIVETELSVEEIPAISER